MQIAPHCFALTGLAGEPPWTVNAGFIVGTEHTLVVDTGYTLQTAETIYGYAQFVRADSFLTVINTEKHLDHILGNTFFFDKGCKIYGHPGIARTAADLVATHADFNVCIQNKVRRTQHEEHVFFGQVRIVNPTKLITAPPPIFELGACAVHILFTPGHTPTNLTVYIPDDGVIYCGDCIVSDYLPNLEDGTPDEWRLWQQWLDTLAALAPRLVVPGHGRILTGEGIDQEITRTRTILAQAIRTGYAPTALR